MNDELLGLLLNIKQTLITSGAFLEFENAPDDSALPYVYGKLQYAIDLLTADEKGADRSVYLH